MLSKQELECAVCGKNYAVRVAEAQRSARLGRLCFCSRSCAGQHNQRNLPAVSSYAIAPHAGNRRDEYSGFREHLRRCRRRGHICSITLADLLLQWQVQEGRCPYTGIDLLQPSYTQRNDVQHTASLDRIDSAQGYIVGNIQFVSMAVNYAKSTLSHEEMVALCQRIARFWQPKE